MGQDRREGKGGAEWEEGEEGVDVGVDVEEIEVGEAATGTATLGT